MAAVERERGTHSFMVPAMYVSLLQHEDQSADLSSLRALVSAGQTQCWQSWLGAVWPGSGAKFPPVWMVTGPLAFARDRKASPAGKDRLSPV